MTDENQTTARFNVVLRWAAWTTFGLWSVAALVYMFGLVVCIWWCTAPYAAMAASAPFVILGVISLLVLMATVMWGMLEDGR